jgi:hypothetical protein
MHTALLITLLVCDNVSYNRLRLWRVAEVDNSKQAKLDSDWRTKCIEEFKLEPVPVTWSDQVARGSETTWKNYFEYRKKQEKFDDEDDEDEDEDDENGVKEAVQEWEGKLEDLAFEIFPKQKVNPSVKWQTHLRVEELLMNDDVEMRSALLLGNVYSPYALPHAIHLEHRYHRRPRYSTMEFFATWGYNLLGFEGEDFVEDYENDEEGFTTLCSNCYEDEELCADVIDVSHLNHNTVDRLRRFLFGAIQESKPVCCDDFSFLRLLFGSMGTFGDDKTSYTTLFRGCIGYSWKIPFDSDSLRNKMIKEGVIGEDDFPDIDWLEHRMREVARVLRPIDGYYTAPTIKDAPGYRSPDSDDDSY